jgi:hypothetical protein
MISIIYQCFPGGSTQPFTWSARELPDGSVEAANNALGLPEICAILFAEALGAAYSADSVFFFFFQFLFSLLIHPELIPIQ